MIGGSRLQRKKDGAKARYMLKNLAGIEIVRIYYDGDESTDYFRRKYRQYIKLWQNGEITSIKIPLKFKWTQIFQWIVSQAGMIRYSEYLFVIPMQSGEIIAEIKVNDVLEALTSLWNHQNFLIGKYYSCGFTLIDAHKKKIIDVNYDSSNEYNYQLYTWIFE